MCVYVDRRIYLFDLYGSFLGFLVSWVPNPRLLVQPEKFLVHWAQPEKFLGFLGPQPENFLGFWSHPRIFLVSWVQPENFLGFWSNPRIFLVSWVQPEKFLGFLVQPEIRSRPCMPTESLIGFVGSFNDSKAFLGYTGGWLNSPAQVLHSSKLTSY